MSTSTSTMSASTAEVQVHEPDTPASSGSPASLGVDAASESKFDGDGESNCVATGNENEKPSSSSSGSPSASPVLNDNDLNHGESSSSSPARSSTPKLSFTPPTNGILTPPNDFEGTSEDSKSDSASGRLKFYKHGILCLELSHHGEGERTKWVQIKTKTVFPTVVHSTKEAVIPRHISPTSFPSPTGGSFLNSMQPRIESSASHSTSDDGSSMLSSPRIRDSCWKKSVPRKEVSSGLGLEFYFKSTSCARIARSRSRIRHQTRKLYRKPYMCKVVSVLIQRENLKTLCACEIENEPRNQNDEDCTDGDGDGNDKGKTSDTLSIDIAQEKSKSKLSKVKSKGRLLAVVDRLNLNILNCHELKYTKRNSKSSTTTTSPHRANDPMQTSTSSSPRSYILPKKRMFNEVEANYNSQPCIRPKKSSPNKNQCQNPPRSEKEKEKTILNIPGLNSDFYKRYSNINANANIEMNGGIERERTLQSKTKLNGNGNGKDSRFSRIDNKLRNKTSHLSQSERNFEGPYPHANSSSAKGLSASAKPNRKNATSPKTKDPHSHCPSPNDLYAPYANAMNSAMSLSNLPMKQLQQEKLFQQQTMSKAISYTINSLLSNPSSAESNNSNSLLIPKVKMESGSGSSKPSKSSASKLERERHNNFSTHNSHQNQNQNEFKMTSRQSHNEELSAALYGLRGDNDQNSFLRHLLDTSDPIPNPNVLKKEKSPNPKSKSQSQSDKHGGGQGQGSRILEKEKHGFSSSSSAPRDRDREREPRSNSFSNSKDHNHKKVPTNHSHKTQAHPSQTNSNSTLNGPASGSGPGPGPRVGVGMYPQASFIHPSLIGMGVGGGLGGFPLPMSAYESLLTGRDPSLPSVDLGALAAAAAAEFQFLSNLNSPMAAAMGASYLGGIPNTNTNTNSNINPGPGPGKLSASVSSLSLSSKSSKSSKSSSSPLSSSRSPVLHANANASRSSRSPVLNYGSNSTNTSTSSSSSPLNLSHRGYNQNHNGLHLSAPGTGIPIPFQAPIGDNRHSRGSASATDYSRHRRDKQMDNVDFDMPLNLSKKS